MMKNYRHGDLCFIGIKRIPEGLEKSDTKILMTGSNGNDHSFDNGEFYPKRENNFVFGYLAADNTTLSHPDHGKDAVNGIKYAKISDGIYQLRNQVEDTHSDMVQVAD